MVQAEKGSPKTGGSTERLIFGLRKISQNDFCEHIGEDDFFLVHGNPLLIRTDAGEEVVCLAWPMMERILRRAGYGEELDKALGSLRTT